MKPLFSVILAGYQTEPYLQKALDSIANQTFRDFEAICYVEESTDRSLELCQAMAQMDPRRRRTRLRRTTSIILE